MTFRKFIDCVMLALCLSWVMAIPIGAEVFVRADGTAPRNNAPGPISDATKCMNLDSLNACTSAHIDNVNGDTVSIGGAGGSYTKQFTVPVGGADASHYVLYAGIDADTPTIDVSANAANAHGILVHDKAFVKIWGFDVKGSGGAGAVRTQGTSGAGGYLVEYRHIDVLTNNGAGSTGNNDGFSLDNSSEADFIDCSAKHCHENTPAGGSHQGLATHATAKARWHGGAMDSCNYWATAIASSDIEITGLSATNAMTIGVSTATSATIDIDSSTLAVAPTMVSHTSAAELNVRNSTISGTVTTIFQLSPTLEGVYGNFDNNTISLSSGNIAQGNTGTYNNTFEMQNCSLAILAWGTGGFARGIYKIHDNVFNIVHCGNGANAGLFQTGTSGGTIQAQRNRFSGFVSVNNTKMFYFGQTSGTPRTNFVRGNLFDKCSDSTLAFNSVYVVNACVAPPEVSRNTWYDSAYYTTSFIRCLGNPSGATFNIKNNIFCKGYRAILNTGDGTNVSFAYNDEFGMNGNIGGTGCITTGPAFVDSVDFKITNASPCFGTGIKTNLNYDAYKNPIPNLQAGTYSMGWFEPDTLNAYTVEWIGGTDSLSTTAANYNSGRAPDDSAVILFTSAADRPFYARNNITALAVYADSTLDKNVHLDSYTNDLSYGFDLRCPACTLFNETSEIMADGNVTYPAAGRVSPGTATLSVTGAGAQSLTNILAYDFVKAGAGTATFANHWKINGDMTVSAGTIAITNHVGKDTVVGDMTVANGATYNTDVDSVYYGGNLTLGATSTVSATTGKWILGKDGVTLAVNGKSIPLLQLIGTGRINGGATIAQLLPASDDSVIIQAATRVNITSIPATTWDGTAGHLKYFLTPTINQGCTLSTPAYTASYGYYGGIHRDSIDAAFSRGCKSRGDNGGF